MGISIEDIETLFINAGKPSGKGFRMTHDLREYFRKEGVKEFKFLALGFGEETVLTEEGLARVLCYSGVVNSIENGKLLAPELNGGKFFYGDDNEHVVGIDITGQKRNENLYLVSTSN